MSIKFNGQGVVVVGGQWGDEGKGRIVDTLAEDCDVVVRFQGGNNAGHSLHIGNDSFVLHLIPCGIVRKNKVCVIGNGVVIDPEILSQEIKMLEAASIQCSPKNLKIAYNAHIIFPFHKARDEKRESLSKHPLGTTKRGIGPCYEDKVSRFGIVASDLLSKDNLEAKLTALLADQGVDGSEYNKESFLESLLQWGLRCGEMIAPFLCDAGEYISRCLKNGQRILFEGAQGALLDIDHGSYPFVTSSNCISAQASVGAGIGPQWLSDIFLVSKAYCTRVGEGPFFTEASDEIQTILRKKGHEFGATTGRPRRCGWLDIPALKHAVRLNGASGLILTKIDVLFGVGPVKIGVSYSCGGEKKLSFTEAMVKYRAGKNIEVETRELPPLDKISDHYKSTSDMPQSLREFCGMIENELEIPIVLVSYGPKRGQEVFCSN